MATDKRNYPNEYFSWYNDDARLAIVTKVITSDNVSTTSYDAWDTYTGSEVTNGLRIHYHSKYTEVSAISDDLSTGSGLDSGLHASLLDYVKSRILEDMGDLQNSQYFRQKYETGIQKYPHRKTGVRFLHVPKI